MFSPTWPSAQSLEEFDFDHARGLKRDTVAHLGTWSDSHLTYMIPIVLTTEFAFETGGVTTGAVRR